MIDADSLARIPLFEGLPRPEISRLLGYLHEKSVPAGTNLLFAEQPGEAVYVILSGSVKVHADRPDGTEVVLGAGVGRTAWMAPNSPTAVCWLSSRERRRAIVLDVKGERVYIDYGAPDANFDEVAPEARKVLDRVEWKGA